MIRYIYTFFVGLFLAIFVGMGISLFYVEPKPPEALGVIAGGLLLGGIFTLLYGIGRGMATNSNAYRFLVASVGLIVTFVLGYLKFMTHKQKSEKDSEPP